MIQRIAPSFTAAAAGLGTAMAMSLTLGLALSSPALAGDAESCHFHGSKAASQDTITGCAAKRQQALVASGKIDKSWQAIKPASIEQVDGQRGKEWKLSYKNPAALDKTKDTLFLFFTLQGNFIAANFTGK